MFTALQIKLLLLCPDSLVELFLEQWHMSVVLSERENVGPQMLKSCFSFHKNTVYEFLNQIDKMKTVNFTWLKSYLLCRKAFLSFIRCYCSTNKVIATLPRQLSWVLWTVTLCQWFWVKEETVGPQMLKSFFLSQKDIYEFLNQILTKWKLFISR